MAAKVAKTQAKTVSRRWIMHSMLETAPALAMKKTAEISAISDIARPRGLTQPGGETGLIVLPGGDGQMMMRRRPRISQDRMNPGMEPNHRDLRDTSRKSAVSHAQNKVKATWAVVSKGFPRQSLRNSRRTG